MTDATKLASKMNLEANTKHLGVQSNDQGGVDMRFSGKYTEGGDAATIFG